MPTVRQRRALFEYVSAGVKPSVPEIGPVLAHQRRQIILLHEFWIHVLQLFSNVLDFFFVASEGFSIKSSPLFYVFFYSTEDK